MCMWLLLGTQLIYDERNFFGWCVCSRRSYRNAWLKKSVLRNTFPRLKKDLHE